MAPEQQYNVSAQPKSSGEPLQILELKNATSDPKETEKIVTRTKDKRNARESESRHDDNFEYSSPKKRAKRGQNSFLLDSEQ